MEWKWPELAEKRSTRLRENSVAKVDQVSNQMNCRDTNWCIIAGNQIELEELFQSAQTLVCACPICFEERQNKKVPFSKESGLSMQAWIYPIMNSYRVISLQTASSMSSAQRQMNVIIGWNWAVSAKMNILRIALHKSDRFTGEL